MLRALTASSAVLAALALVPVANTSGGRYVFFGGTGADRAQVRHALDASSFDWSLVPAVISIRISPGVPAHATPGTIWLDPALLRAGVFSWAVVQDEYAHQVDWFLLDDQERSLLNSLLGSRVWCHADKPGLPHSAYGCERFTSTLVWAYWPSRSDAYRPGMNPEAMLSPAVFRRVLGGFLS